MAILGVDDFKAQLKGGGARANLFKVTLNFPAYADAGDAQAQASFLCKTAALPASSVGQFEVPFRGRVLKLPSERTFDNWTVTILNDTDFVIRDAMERWSNGISGHRFNTGLLDPSVYQVDLVVEQLDRDQTSGEGKVIKRVDLRGAYPVNISEIALDYDTTGAIETFDVEFAYQYWEANTTS